MYWFTTNSVSSWMPSKSNFVKAMPNSSIVVYQCLCTCLCEKIANYSWQNRNLAKCKSEALRWKAVMHASLFYFPHERKLPDVSPIISYEENATTNSPVALFRFSATEICFTPIDWGRLKSVITCLSEPSLLCS